MQASSSPYHRCLLFAAGSLARVMNRLADEAFAEAGLTSSYAFLLMSVLQKPGIQPMELAHELALTRSTITRLLEKLEQRGLISRVAAGRIIRVYPTAACHELDPVIQAGWHRVFESYSEILGEAQGRDLTAAVYAAAQRLGAEDSASCAAKRLDLDLGR